ncbi:acetate--CoA ligase family protein [Amycolatopsis jejuensis]|uniref:acetate--CoA ligase family protein n=1 Tax=Amycolatopsis jejuensis TaxID=330084 RepID=UPI00068A14AF|nr:acetate--CoA ligase family protein [Amycolatopsis jejuensis]
MTGHPLDRLFRPASIAVVGASPKGGYGLRTLRNTRSLGFAGRLYAVHPRHSEVDGVAAYPALRDLPEVPDAVALAVPAPSIPDLVDEATELGVGAMVAYAAGFAERDAAGRALQERLKTGIPVVGPNCLGVASYRGRAALWGIEMPYGHAETEGVVALAAQSGNMALTTMLSGRLPSVAYGVSAGNQAVVDVADCLEYYLTDPAVRVVALVIEGLRDLPRFRELALRAAEQDVAIVVLKVGRSARGEAATLAHTGTLAGRDSAYTALFRQTGVYRVDDLDEMIALCRLLAAPRRPRGRSLGLFASSGGECGLLSDLAEDIGVPLAELDEPTAQAMAEVVPDHAAVANPLDLTAGAWGQLDVYAKATRAFGESPDVDVVAFVGDAPTYSEPLAGNGWPEMVGGAGKAAAQLDVPVALITTTTDIVRDLDELAEEHGVVLLAGVRPALRAIALAGTPRPRSSAPAAESGLREQALGLLKEPVLTETNGKDLLALYGLPTPSGRSVGDLEAAVTAAEEIGYPVVAKLEAPGLTHKSDIGGVITGLADQAAVRTAFAALIDRGQALGTPLRVRIEQMASPGVELIVGGRNDPAGSLVVIGAGGVLTELLADATELLWPFGSDEVIAALDTLRINRLLRGYRGAPPADVAAIADAVVRIGQLLHELPEVTELDVNPLLCTENGCLALDALVAVDPAGKGQHD